MTRSLLRNAALGWIATASFSAGCTAPPDAKGSSTAVEREIDRFVARHAGELEPSQRWRSASDSFGSGVARPAPWAGAVVPGVADPPGSHEPYLLSAVYGSDDAAPTSQRGSELRSRTGAVYWRPTLLRQMGGEFKELITHDLLRGFETVFWNLENEAVLLSTLGASIAIRETGVDNAIRRRTEGEFKLGDLDETIQIIGNPSTHFIGTGMLWLGSAATRDLKNHEVAQSLTQALCVNGITTMVLKLSTNTRGPDTDNRAWPSGHTSSAFTVAAVVNEYYGPWVGLPSLALAGLVGYQRIDSRVHDFSDVVFGAMLGYVVGTSIAKDQKAEFPELFGMKVVPYSDPGTGATGLALWKSW